MEKEKKPQGLAGRLSIRVKLVMAFAFTALLLFMVNLLLYSEVNRSMNRLDEVYATNASLNEMSECLEDIHENVMEYLNTKSSDSLEDYYRDSQTYQDMLEQLNGDIVDDERGILEKNIRNMSGTYLRLAEETIQAKRGRNVEAYKAAFAKETRNYEYIQTAIYCLNSRRFRDNSDNYEVLRAALGYTELASSLVLAAVVVANLLILFFLIRRITEPLRLLAVSANKVAQGDFALQLPEPQGNDEVAILTGAFNKMVCSIREYIVRMKESMEKEQKMMERELLMETHLKDTQLRYLQAQINPHFLFNSLNAGAQLAMMEDAEKTSIFIEKMADFFRYNVRRDAESATLAEELETVDNYVYILNVRFFGEIHFEKEVPDGVGEIRLPSMILQPIVENAVSHGIREVEGEGWILLKIEQGKDGLVIRVRDNGQGMTAERIQEVLEGRISKEENGSTGIGLDNVISRMELFFNRKGLVQIFSDGPGQGTEVRLTVPIVTPSGRCADGGNDVQSIDRG